MSMMLEKVDTTDFNKLTAKLDFESMVYALKTLAPEERSWYKNSLPEKRMLQLIATFVESTTGIKIKPNMIHGGDKHFPTFKGTSASRILNLLIELQQLEIVMRDIDVRQLGIVKQIRHYEFT